MAEKKAYQPARAFTAIVITCDQIFSPRKIKSLMTWVIEEVLYKEAWTRKKTSYLDNMNNPAPRVHSILLRFIKKLG